MAAWPAPACRVEPRKRLRYFVMAGLDPAIHVFLVCIDRDVDARVKPGHDGPCVGRYSSVTLNRSALPTTLTDDSAIAAAAMIGDSSTPNAG